MNAKELWDECVNAYMECPQARSFAFDDESSEFGWTKTYKELRNSTMEEVINYWRSFNTIGGKMLWDKGYGRYVSDEAKRLINPDLPKRHIVVPYSK